MAEEGSILIAIASQSHFDNAVALAPFLKEKTGFTICGLDFNGLRQPMGIAPALLSRTFDFWEYFQIANYRLFKGQKYIERLVSFFGGNSLVERFHRSRVRAAFLNALHGTKCRTIVLFNDRFFPERDMVRIASEAGIPCLLVQESLRKDLGMDCPPGTLHGQAGCDRVLAWGPSSVDYFRAVGVPAGKIVLSGNPKFDAFCARFKDIDPRAVRARLGLNDQGVVLVASNPVYNMFMQKPLTFEQYANSIEQVISACAKRSLHVIVKPHPSERSAYTKNKFDEVLAAKNNVSLIWKIDLAETLSLTDKVFIFNSTVGLEAVSCGCRVGLLSLHPWESGVDFVATGLAENIATVVDLERFLDSGDIERAQAAMARDVLADGKANERITEEIQKMIAAGSEPA